jgi:hypothetical protein
MARSWADSAYYERRRTLKHTKTSSYYGELSSHLVRIIKYGKIRCFTQQTRCQIQRETKPTLSQFGLTLQCLQRVCIMYVWNGNPAVLLTTWAKTTTADNDPEKAGSRGFVSWLGFGLGSTEPRHSFLDSLLAPSTLWVR